MIMPKSKTFSDCLMIIFLIGLGFFACLDPIEFDVEGLNQDDLVIQMKLINGPQPVVLGTVNKLFQFDADSRRPINLETMKIIHQDGAEMEVPKVSIGTYFLQIDTSEYPVNTGDHYQLYCKTTEGVEYLSTPEPLAPRVKPSDILLKEITKENRANRLGSIQIDTFYELSVDIDFTVEQNENQPRVIWEFWRPPNNSIWPHPFRGDLFCSTDNTIAEYGFTIIDLNQFKESDLINLAIGDFRARDFDPNDICVIVYQESLSDKAYQYWEKVNQLITVEPEFLRDLPGKLPTNFSNINDPEDDVFGYFYCTYRDTLSL